MSEHAPITSRPYTMAEAGEFLMKFLDQAAEAADGEQITFEQLIIVAAYNRPTSTDETCGVMWRCTPNGGHGWKVGGLLRRVSKLMGY